MIQRKMKKEQKAIVQQLQSRVNATSFKWWLKFILNFAIKFLVKHLVKYAYEKSKAEDVDTLMLKLCAQNYRASLTEISIVGNNIIDFPKLSEPTEGKILDAVTSTIYDLTEKDGDEKAPGSRR